MNDIEYIFEGHDLTKEIVMVQGRDNTDKPWSIPRRLCLVMNRSHSIYITIDEAMFIFTYTYARLATATIKPWTLETAPRHLEVELEKGLFYVAFIKTKDGVTFLKDANRYYLTWDELTQYNQWDGSPCGEVVE
jgi:hypothetical protein